VRRTPVAELLTGALTFYTIGPRQSCIYERDTIFANAGSSNAVRCRVLVRRLEFATPPHLMAHHSPKREVPQ
jgi:hypothetical protein